MTNVNANLKDFEHSESQKKLNYNRQPKLTLKKIHELRKIRNARKLQLLKDQAFFGVIYAVPEAEGGEGGGF